MSEESMEEFATLESRLRNRRAADASPPLKARIQNAIVRELAVPRPAALSVRWFIAVAAAVVVLFLNLGIITASASNDLSLASAAPVGTAAAAVAVQDLGVDLPPAEVRRIVVLLAAAENLAPVPAVPRRAPAMSALQGDHP